MKVGAIVVGFYAAAFALLFLCMLHAFATIHGLMSDYATFYN